MDSARQEITSALQKALEDLGIEEKPTLSIPSSSEHGDFTTNIALVASKKAKKNPFELAEAIIGNLKLEIRNLKFIDKIDVARPGFINFYLSKEHLLKQLSSSFWEATTSPESVRPAQDKSDSGHASNAASQARMTGSLSGKRFMVEFAHPNTHKAFHIGHLRNITTGESIVRLLKATGAEVIPVNYQGDVGMHIAKCLYAFMQISNLKSQISNVRTQDVQAKVEFLGKAYAEGSAAFESDEAAKAEIKDLNALIYASAQQFAKEQGEEPGTTDYLALVKPENRTRLDEVYTLWKETRQWSLDYFESIYKRVYTKYDRYYFESECLAGVDLAKEAVKKGILKESDGAIIFDGTEYGLHTRVFVNSLGLPTYEGKELALATTQFKEYGHLDKLIHVLGPEQVSFTQVTFKAEELLGIQNNQQQHVVYGWVKLKHGKMSSRSGNVVLGEWLLDEAKTQIKKQFPEMETETLEKVAVGAVKYSMLKFGLTSEISFSFEESISLEGNSGPYLQYTFVRTQSILKKVKNQNAKGKITIQNSKLEPEELTLLRLLNRFPVVIEEAASQFAPNVLANYLFELAQKFNLFYQKHKILESEQKDFRLALTQGVGKVLKEGLSLLGIQAPDRM